MPDGQLAVIASILLGGTTMPDFAPWLEHSSSTDPKTKALQDFARAAADRWPAASNSIEDYQRIVAAHASADQRDELQTALGRLYERWFTQERQGALKQLAAHPGLLALFAGGLTIAVGLVYGVFFNGTFFDLMARSDHARGLITFLFSFATIGIIVVVAISILWMDVTEVDKRFAHAKDIITILVGILGTVLGFYFGSASGGNNPPKPPEKLAVSAIAVKPNPASAGDKVTVSTKATGGSGPYQYDILFDGSASGFDATGMNIRGRSSGTGDISEEIATPADVPKQLDLTAKIVVKDAGGTQAEPAAAKMTISPKPAAAPAAPAAEGTANTGSK